MNTPSSIDREMSLNGLTVAFFAPRFHNNQIGWVQALEASGARVDYLCHSAGPKSSDAPDRGVPIPRAAISALHHFYKKKTISQESGLFSEDLARQTYLPSAVWLARYLTTRRPGLFISRDDTRSSYFALMLARLLGVRCRLLYVQEPVGHEFQRSSGEQGASQATNLRLRRGIVKRILSRQGIPTISPLIDPRYRKKVSSTENLRDWKNQFFVPFVIAAAQESSVRSKQSATRIKIVVLAKFRPYKNLPLLVKALGLLDDETIRRIELIVAGQAREEKELRLKSQIENELARIPNLSSSVKTNLAPQEVTDLLKVSHIFVLTSASDLAPISPLEAMGMGAIPIISSKAGTSCFIEEGVTGSTFEPTDPEGLSARIKFLVSDSSERGRISVAGWKYAADVFNADQFTRRFAFALSFCKRKIHHS